MDERLAYRLELLARWWHSATQEARFEALRRSINADPQAPSLGDLKTAIILAEVEAGEVEEG